MSKRLQVSIPNALFSALEKKAAALHIGATDAARMAIVEWVAKPLPVQALRLVPPEQVPVIAHKVGEVELAEKTN